MPFHCRWEWKFQASPEALWPFVTDTNRFNYDLGLPSVEKSAFSAGVRRHFYEARAAGILLKWEEFPFEWVFPRYFSIRRNFFSGPLHSMHVRYELHPEAKGGSRLVYEIDLTPRNFIGSLLIPAQFGEGTKRRFEKVFRRYDMLALQGKFCEAGEGGTKIPSAAQNRLHAMTRELAGLSPLAGRLADWILKADELSLSRIRPYVLAENWQVSKKEILDLFFHAASVGLVEFQWEVLCPHCRNTEKETASLLDIGENGYCEGCDTDYAVNFDQLVELTFRPNPRIRSTPRRLFCAGSPQRTPHVMAQILIEPGRSVKLPLKSGESGRYRARFKYVPREQFFTVSREGSKEVRCRLAEGKFETQERLYVSPEAVFEAVNLTSESRQFMIERAAWTEPALTASEAIRAPLFRELFQAQVLRPGVRLSVGNLALVFTDLKGSTRFYEEEGDARAFSQVMRHFEILKEIFEARRGTLIKTIGDAVMAVFENPAEALRAVLESQARLLAGEGGTAAFWLKAGVHYGACMAVTMNGKLDYFGTSVNIASRLAHLAGGGEVVLSEAVYRDPDVREFFERENAGLPVRAFEAAVKGLEERPLRLYRIMKRN